MGSSVGSGEPSSGTESETGWRTRSAQKAKHDGRQLCCGENTHMFTHYHYVPLLSASAVPFCVECTGLPESTQSPMTRPKCFSAGAVCTFVFVLGIYETRRQFSALLMFHQSGGSQTFLICLPSGAPQFLYLHKRYSRNRGACQKGNM